MEKQRCSETVFTGERWDFGGHPCTRRAKVEIKGKWYCTIHTPAYQAEKRRKWYEKYERDSAARQAKQNAGEEREQARDACMHDKADLIAALRACVDTLAGSSYHNAACIKTACALLARLDKGVKP